jgi:membrane associated rhomboid family serine protease
MYVLRGLVGALLGLFAGIALGLLYAYVVYDWLDYGGNSTAPDGNAFVGILSEFWGGVVGLFIGATLSMFLYTKEVRRSRGAEARDPTYLLDDT